MYAMPLLNSCRDKRNTTFALNIAEGSTGQSDAEQARFLSMAIRSLFETVACQHLIHRRQYLDNSTMLREAYQASEKLVAKLHSMRRTILGDRVLHETRDEYSAALGTPFDEQSKAES
jgi:23S rRNA-intervening sequence protein